MVTIFPCSTSRQLKLFERVPESIHNQDRYFVPPFPGSITKIFKPGSVYQRHGELLAFVAMRNDKPVGRIAAIVNRQHNEYHKDKLGFFGFFDSIDDTEVATALFDRAREELKQRGFDSMRGPYNPTINDECGVLVEGFEASPFVMMAYNPPYYPNLYEACGFNIARKLSAYYISGKTIAPERVDKIVERIRRNSKIQLRNINMKKLGDELRIIQQLFNETLCRNWGFVPLTYEDLEFAADDLKQITDPELVFIAEKDGQPIGFSLCIPNINEFLWKAKGSKGVVRFAKVVWSFLTKRPREARLAILGVKPEFRNKGVGVLFYYETLMKGGAKYLGGELSWIDEDNDEISKAIVTMGGQRYKGYRIYERPIGSA